MEIYYAQPEKGKLKTFRRRARKPKTLHPAIGPKQYFIYDGRNSIGTVTEVSGRFIATDADGEVIGRFPTLIAATRALPARRPQ
jgi:hypothetical protein